MRFDELREAFLYAPTDVLDPFKAGPWEDVFGGGAVISLAQLKRGLHRLLKCRRRGVGLEAPPLSVVGPPIPGGAPVPAPPAASGAAALRKQLRAVVAAYDDANLDEHADFAGRNSTCEVFAQAVWRRLVDTWTMSMDGASLMSLIHISEPTRPY